MGLGLQALPSALQALHEYPQTPDGESKQHERDRHGRERHESRAPDRSILPYPQVRTVRFLPIKQRHCKQRGDERAWQEKHRDHREAFHA